MYIYTRLHKVESIVLWLLLAIHGFNDWHEGNGLHEKIELCRHHISDKSCSRNGL